MLKKIILSFLGIPLLAASIVITTPVASAYTSYNDCIGQQSVALAPNGGLSDAELTRIETSCGAEFPNQANNSELSASVRGRNPSTAPSSRSSVSPSVSANPAASTTASVPPTASNSAAPITSPSATSTSNNGTTEQRPYGGFINDSRGVPTLDPQQYVNAYQGTSFSRLTSTRDAFGFLTSFALSFIGMVAIMFLIYAGFVYITANGEQAKIDKAKKLIWGTVIGILIVFSVYAIVATLLNISAAVNPGLNIGPLNVGPGGTTLRLP